MKRCGDFGGRKRNGEPCRRPTTDGPCPQHSEDALEDRFTQQEAFLDAFESLGSISAAAKAVRIARRNHYNWFEEDASYPSRFAAARTGHQRFKRQLGRAARALLLRKLIDGSAGLGEICLALRNDPEVPWEERPVEGAGLNADEVAGKIRQALDEFEDLHRPAEEVPDDGDR